MPNKGSVKILSLLMLLGILLSIPSVLSQYSLHMMILVLVFVVISTSWNILVWTHQISLGHAAFFGIGAYTAALV